MNYKLNVFKWNQILSRDQPIAIPYSLCIASPTARFMIHLPNCSQCNFNSAANQIHWIQMEVKQMEKQKEKEKKNGERAGEE